MSNEGVEPIGHFYSASLPTVLRTFNLGVLNGFFFSRCNHRKG